MKDGTILYVCDPEKNVTCTKEGCQIFHECYCTTHQEFAELDENGNPRVDFIYHNGKND